MVLTAGDHFASFTITEFLGSGRTGRRYRAVDRESGDTVHLKIVDPMAPPDPDRRHHFLDTNEILMRADVVGVPRILDFGDSEGLLWTATELIGGVNAGTLLLERFPSGMPHQSLWLIADHIAQTLDTTSRHGVAHGDVTPSKILLSAPFSKNYRIAVTDFGFRYVTDTSADSSYAAPEVLTGGAASNLGDQFALAASVFRLLTGRPAFGDRGRAVTTSGSLRFDAAALDAASLSVDGLEAVFARAFSFDPAKRYSSCRELVDALIQPPSAAPAAGALSPPQSRTVAPTPATSEGTAASRRGAGRSVLLPAAVAIVAAVTLTVVAVAFSPSRRAPGPPTAASPAPAQIPVPVPAEVPRPPACQRLNASLAGLGLRQKLAQTLMVGVTGIDDARAVVNDQQVGGIFIGSWTDLSMLETGELRELQSATRPIPLAVSVDEEGGRVQRLKAWIGSQDSPRQLVAEGTSVQQVHDIAFDRGQQMRQFGITIDFAPVVDVTAAADNTVIGDRSFSSDPATVTAYAGAYARGLRDAGLLPVLKHFPGHGRASGDSHRNGVTTPPIADLMATDLVPYRTLVTQRPLAVMLGHMQVPGLTDDDPASLSKAAYELLRRGAYDGTPFDGATFTDDLSSMGAINQRYSVPDAVLKALQAGADTALWISTDAVPAVLDRLENAVNSGELATARVDDAVRTMAVTKDPGLACPS